MQIFNSSIFWFIEGILLCLALVGFRVWAEDRGVALNIWKWALLLLWVLFTGFTIAFVGTGLGENEPTAAYMGGLIFGLISIISAVALWRFAFAAKKSAITPNKSSTPEENEGS